MKLTCDPGHVIRIDSAMYGRLSDECDPTEHGQRASKGDNRNCTSDSALDIVMNKCDGRSVCEFKVNKKVFGNPCKGTYKYSKVKHHCEKALPTDNTSDLISTNIVNGEVAAPHSHPSQLSLQRNSHICGAVLVSPSIALTAAHCVDEGRLTDYRVQCGAHNLRVSEASRQTAGVETILLHPEYSPSVTYGRPAFPNDIALLKLQTPLVSTPECQPATLPHDDADFAGMDAVITGWGLLSGNDYATPWDLREGYVNILSPSECSNSRNWGAYASQNFHLCVKDIGDMVYGGCNGDSGGPVHVGGKVVGVSSFSTRGCHTEYPSVYTRLSFYRDWIADNVAALG